MLKDTVNGGKKIKKGAGIQDNKTLLTITSVAEIKEKSKELYAELEGQWNLEAKGKANRKVLETLKKDYLTFKVGNHVAYKENGKIIKREPVTQTKTEQKDR